MQRKVTFFLHNHCIKKRGRAFNIFWSSVKVFIHSEPQQQPHTKLSFSRLNINISSSLYLYPLQNSMNYNMRQKLHMFVCGRVYHRCISQANIAQQHIHILYFTTSCYVNTTHSLKTPPKHKKYIIEVLQLTTMLLVSHAIL